MDALLVAPRTSNPYHLVISVTYPKNRCGQVWTYRKSVDKSVDKMDFEKTQNRKSLLLFTEMDASLVGAPDFKSVPL